MNELERLVAAVITDVMAEDACLETLSDCSPEEFDRRAILLGNERMVNIGHANKAQLELLAVQLQAAGLPMPALLERKLAHAA